MAEEWTVTIELEEASSQSILKMLEEQDKEFIERLFDGEEVLNLRWNGKEITLAPVGKVESWKNTGRLLATKCDLTSRQAAVEALEEPLKVSDTWTDEYAVGERMQWEKDVKALNSLPPAQQWIPVSERPPEELQTVIASVDTGIYPEAIFKDGRWWWALKAWANYWEEIKMDVTAWMPLPKPYRKEMDSP